MTWKDDLDAAWQDVATMPPDDFRGLIEQLVSNPDVPETIRQFHTACAFDSTGSSDIAIQGYQRALDAGLDGYERRRAIIQMASSLRNLGESDRSVEILSAEPTDVGDGLDEAVVIFHALALSDLGREREGVVRLVHALAEHLPRYTASAHRYADALLPSSQPTADALGPKGSTR